MKLLSILFLILQVTVGAQSVVDTKPLHIWLKKQENIRSIQATFTQTRSLPSVRKPLTTTGKLTMQKPQRFRWELGDPASSMAISDGTTTYLMDMVKLQARKIGVDDPASKPFSLMASKAFENKDSFHQTFHIQQQTQVDAVFLYSLLLRDAAAAKHLREVILSISNDGDIKAIELVLSDQSRIKTTMNAVKLNAAIPATTFTPNLQGFKVR
jgi:outer membrane lipoprotein carrier protein